MRIMHTQAVDPIISMAFNTPRTRYCDPKNENMRVAYVITVNLHPVGRCVWKNKSDRFSLRDQFARGKMRIIFRAYPTDSRTLILSASRRSISRCSASGFRFTRMSCSVLTSKTMLEERATIMYTIIVPPMASFNAVSIRGSCIVFEFLHLSATRGRHEKREEAEEKVLWRVSMA